MSICQFVKLCNKFNSNSHRIVITLFECVHILSVSVKMKRKNIKEMIFQEHLPVFIILFRKETGKSTHCLKLFHIFMCSSKM